MAFDNEFSRNDFSCIKKKVNIKRAVPECSIFYDGEMWYIWKREEEYLVTYSRHNSKCHYDFSKEGDRRRFYYNEMIFIQDAVAENKATFQTYRMFDVLFHFREFFKI